MKLYNLDHSPYATRVRVQIRKKELDVAIEAPPVALGSPEFIQRFPLGKIPVLELDDGSQLPDSWVIMEYLEDVMPALPLRPQGARACAHMQLLARYTDTYLARLRAITPAAVQATAAKWLSQPRAEIITMPAPKGKAPRGGEQG